MDTCQKTSEELLAEIAELRGRIGELEANSSDRGRANDDLESARQRFEYLLAFSPAIIYTTQASGKYECTYVSENIRTIMGFSPQEMTTDAKCWPDQLHPDDAQRVFAELGPLIEQGGGAVEYRFRHRDGHYVWIQDTFKVIYDSTKLEGPDRSRNAGRPLELVGAWADITTRKEAEHAALDATPRNKAISRSIDRKLTGCDHLD
jgi:PAS domain S-box-containing protein